MSSRQTSDMEKAEVIEEMMEVAKGLGATQNQPVALGQFSNNRGRILNLYATHSWTGHFQQQPNGSVNAGDQGRFTHRGTKGAVIYGEDRAGSNPAGYLLAWFMANTGLLRVYVKCGPLSEVYYNGWETAALTSLDSSGVESSAQDSGTSSRVQAQIRNESSTFPLAVVLASFA